MGFFGFRESTDPEDIDPIIVPLNKELKAAEARLKKAGDKYERWRAEAEIAKIDLKKNLRYDELNRNLLQHLKNLDKKKKEKEEIVPESKESSEARRILIEQIQKEASELSRSWNFQKTKKKNQSLNL